MTRVTQRMCGEHSLFHRKLQAIFKGKRITVVREKTARTKEAAKIFAGSCLGKIVAYTAAELTGAQIGSIVGRVAIGKVSSKIGQDWVPFLAMVTFLIGVNQIIYVMAYKASQATRSVFMLIASVFVTFMMNRSRENLITFGDSLGLEIGEQIGQLSGVVLGGYVGLYLAGSPTKFVNQDDPWSSYLMGMIRYLGTDIAFSNCVGVHPNPVAEFFLSMPRNGVCTGIKTVAFNSNVILPAIKGLREQWGSKKAVTRILTQVIVNKLSGQNSQRGPTIYEKINATLSSFFSPVTTQAKQNIPYILRRLCEKVSGSIETLAHVVEGGIKGKVEKKKVAILNKGAQLFVNLLLRSSHHYVNLIKNSTSVCTAHANFKAAFHDAAKYEQSKVEFANALDAEVKTVQGYTQELFQSVVEMWDKERKELSDSFIKMIHDYEIEMVGFPILKQEGYLAEVIDVYLKYYFLFTFINYEQLTKPLTITEEESIIVDLINFVIGTYVDQVAPSMLVSKINFLAKGGLYGLLKAKKAVEEIATQQDQHVRAAAQGKPIIHRHFQVPPVKPISKDYVHIRMPKDDFVMVPDLGSADGGKRRKRPQKVVQLKVS